MKKSPPPRPSESLASVVIDRFCPLDVDTLVTCGLDIRSSSIFFYRLFGRETNCMFSLFCILDRSKRTCIFPSPPSAPHASLVTCFLLLVSSALTPSPSQARFFSSKHLRSPDAPPVQTQQPSEVQRKSPKSKLGLSPPAMSTLPN